MDTPALLPGSRRAVLVAVGLSAAVHGAVLMGGNPFGGPEVSLEAPAYTASLEPLPAPMAEVQAVAAPRPRAKPRARSAPRAGEAVALLPEALEAGGDDLAQALPEIEKAAGRLEEAPPLFPEVVALARPAAEKTPMSLPDFRPDAFPPEVTIRYALTSAFADGQAEYTWKRDGERYEISGSAQAVGFFTLFLEGRIDQSSSGRVTPGGLQPERFSERRGDQPEEGLDFDWSARRVEFRRGGARRSAALTDSTVDWLSMIFQLAHAPPRDGPMDLRVFTQRRLYQYRLEVLGREEVELPFGRVDALHLRHAGEKEGESVDVWLGIDQHYLPVKLRYPVARNRLVVEQTATSITAR